MTVYYDSDLQFEASRKVEVRLTSMPNNANNFETCMLPKKWKHVESRLPKAVLEHLGDVSSLEGKVQRAQEAGLGEASMEDHA